MTDTLTYAPYDITSVDVKPDVNITPFGDGYSQRQPAFINTVKQMWTLNYSIHRGSEVAAVDAFFKAQLGVRYFYWTPPRDVQRKFVCRTWKRTLDYDDVVQSISATIEEVFEG